MRSECGARARSRKPLPGGSGPPLGRHDDRPPRSSVDSRQANAGNTRRAGSQETRELELSQRRMRSPWRVPRRSAERRAARDRAAAAQQMSCADHGWCACRRSASLLGEAIFFVRVVVHKARMLNASRERFFVVVIASQRVRPEVAGPMVNSAKQSSSRAMAGLLRRSPPRNDDVVPRSSHHLEPACIQLSLRTGADTPLNLSVC
jgi:hypothetical protein